MNALKIRLRSHQLLAAAITATCIGIAVLVTLDLLLVGPLYLVSLAGVAAAWFARNRVLRVVGFTVAGAFVVLMFSIGLLGHEILGLSVVGICAALAADRYGLPWLRISSGLIGFFFGTSPISMLIQSAAAGPFKMALLFLALATTVISLIVLVPALTTVALKFDALGIALLTASFSLAASGLLGFFTLSMDAITQDSAEFEKSAAYFAMMIDVLGTRVKDVVMSIAVPVIFGIWGLVRVFSARGYAPEQSQRGTLALHVASAVTLTAYCINAVIFGLIGIHSPLNYAAPVFEFGALVLWIIAVVIARNTFALVRIHHLPGNSLDLRSRVAIGVLLIAPAAGAALELVLALVPVMNGQVTPFS
ncbi:hypothetical protein [Arthrobacter sp. H35-D1]|uniref:hypothetical protein n=1 Tax=Arthrobacter sp. H35-D1 TaxID=3046202 RepID=UPI0024B8B6EC|nr:hypothetical protein [Arthrobacter sp. H35-D1]MDJ0315339.1 hypothetical protein [Arthrobacter sp. H35-D1]